MPPGWARKLAAEIAPYDANLQKLMVESVPRWWNMHQGGNMWGQYDSYLTGCRDILGLRLPAHEKYKFWEEAAIHGSYRMMHEEFCIVSNFPAVIKKDESNRPHCEDGPSHLWRDGTALWHWHGIKVESWIITNPELITVENINAESNAEIRRILTERYGWSRYMKDSNGKVIDQYIDSLGFPVKLWSMNVSGYTDSVVKMVEFTNSSVEGLNQGHTNKDGEFVTTGFKPDLKNGETYHKTYMFCVPPDITSAKKAHAWHCGLDTDEVEFYKQT